MKTSNKVLGSALTLFLLFAIVNTIRFKGDHTEIQTLFTQLEQTRIHTLIAESREPYKVFRHKGRPQSISLDGMDNLENIRISHDTLYMKNIFVYTNLPYLENYLLNGEPQPLPEENK